MIAGVLEIQLMANMARLSDDMRRAERVVTGHMSKVESSVASAKRAMSQLGMGLSVGILADTLRRTVDSYTKLDAQLRLSTKSQEQYNKALSDIRSISSVAQSDITATTMLYTRLLNVMDGTGVSQEKLNLVTQTVSFGLKAYGATAQEAASASLQLSQAMGANRLGGEEFRAVMEAMPNIMKVLANSMGVPLGELRALSIAGKITAEEMVKAWGNPEIAAQFRKLAENAQTITGAWTVARNELTLLVGEFAKSSGATGSMIAGFKGLAEIIKFLADNMGVLLNALYAYITVVGGKFIIGLIAARAAQANLNAAHAEALAMNVAEEQAKQKALVSTMAANRASIAAATAKLAEADAVGALTVAHYNETRAAESNIAVKQAERALSIQNLAAIGKESAAVNAVIASKGAAVSNALKAERAAILERRALAKIELAQIDASIAAYKAQAAANVQAEQAMTAAMAQRTAMQTKLLALEEAQIIAEKQLAASTAGVAAAQKLHAAGTVSVIGRIKGLVGRAGWIGMALFGVWTVVDFLTGMQSVADGAKKTVDEMSNMTLAQMQLLRNAKALEIALMKQSMFSGFNENEIRIAEQALRAIDQQITKTLEGMKKGDEESTKFLGNMDNDSRYVLKQYEKLQKQLKDNDITQADFNAKVRDLYAHVYPNLISSSKELAKARKDEFAVWKDMSGIADRLEAEVLSDNLRLTETQKVEQKWKQLIKGRTVTLKEELEYQRALEAARAADQIKRAADTEKAIIKQRKALQAQQAELAGTQRETAGIVGQNALFGLTGEARLAAELEQAKKAEDMRYAAQLEAQARRIQTMIDENTWEQDTATEQAAIMEEMERQHQERLTQIEQEGITKRQAQQTGLLKFATLIRQIDFKASKEKLADDVNNALKAGAEITAEFAQRSRTMFELNKAFSISSAIIDTLVAIGKIQREFPGPVGWAMGAVQAGLGALRVAQIANTKFGGGGVGAVSAGVSAAAGAGVPSMATSAPIAAPVTPALPTPAAAPVRRIDLYLRGDDIYSAKSVREQLVPALNDALDDGVIINVRPL